VTASLIQQAAQSAVESETNEDTYVPPDLLKYHPGIPKVLIKFDGTAATGSADLTGVDYSYGVASLVDNGVGDYTINFTDNFADTDYVVSFGMGDISTWTTSLQTFIKTRAVGSITINTDYGGGSFQDCDDVNVVIWGALA
jgi:hypothetical protein